MRSHLAPALALSVLWLVGAACADRSHAPYASGVTPAEPPAPVADAGLDLGDASPAPDGKCGSQVLQAIEDPPNLYFVIDHSASMGEELAGSDVSKYENARLALALVLRAVGHRVLYGAAVFPGLSNVTGCEPGEQIRGVSAGDPPSYARAGKTGPLLLDLLERLSIADVKGGTPVSSTLLTLTPQLSVLPGRSYLVLITDGAPNCNEALSCEAAGCIPNIEGFTLDGEACSGENNCCAPSQRHPEANLSCVDDRPSIDAVAALASAGLATYVVGMPGSEPYASLLDQLAEAGGTAREGALKYYSVTDTAELTLALTKIAASVAISCEIALDEEPENRDFINVYFDDELLKLDPEDGWAWSDEGHVLILGAACERLSSGGVLEVQILEGCETQVK